MIMYWHACKLNFIRLFNGIDLIISTALILLCTPNHFIRILYNKFSPFLTILRVNDAVKMSPSLNDNVVICIIILF